MVKRKHNGSRNAFDNPLAAARSGKSTTKKELTERSRTKKDGSVTSVDWIEFGTPTKKTSAGGGKNNKGEKQASKTSAKAEQIWHRRSGAGFHLFVDYYLGQPEGIVTVSGNDEAPLAQQNQKLLQNSSALPSGGAGQSRAALRRKKKKRRKVVVTDTASNDQNDGQQETTTTTAAAATNQHMPITYSFSQGQLLYGGRLLDVLSSKIKSKSERVTNTTAKANKTTNFHPPSSAANFRNFLTTLSKPLPLTFRFRRYQTHVTSNNTNGDRDSDDAGEKGENYHPRIVPSYQQRRQRIQKIKGLRQILKGKTLAKSNVRPVLFDPEYIYQAMAPPQNNAHHEQYQHPFPIDKASLKRTCPQLKEFLNEHTNDGTIARQELGSMLPVWLLDRVGAFSSFQNGRGAGNKVPLRVLDTCASPGSKTLQVAELVSITKGGRVRANDVNSNRLESLKEALERSGFFGDCNGESDSDDDENAASSMNSLLRFSNVDASRFPIPKSETKKYPIIMCDVPCSGDGTVRKDVHVIPNWTPNISNALHSLQVKILGRALRCVALDGIVSYSTCSLNPIEDEAVVRAALEIEKKDGKFGFELMQVSKTQLSGLVLRKGVVSWRVAGFSPERTTGKTDRKNEDDDDTGDGEAKMDDGSHSDETVDDHDEKPAQLQWYESYQDALDGGMKGALQSMWPPIAVDEMDDESCSSSSLLTPLDRCLRLLPQDQDTGGFFVAFIRRTK